MSDPLTPGFTKMPRPLTSQTDSLTDDESEISSQSTLTLLSFSSGDASDVCCSSQRKRTSTPVSPSSSGDASDIWCSSQRKRTSTPISPPSSGDASDVWCSSQRKRTSTPISPSSSGDASDVWCSSQRKRTSPISPKMSSSPVSVQGKTTADLPSEFIIPSKFGKITDGNLKSGNITDVDRAKVIKTVATCVWVHTDSPSPGCCEWLAKQLISKYPTLADADPRKMLQTVPAPNEDFKYWVRFLMSCKLVLYMH